MQALPKAEKHVRVDKRGKTFNRCRARESMQAVPSAGKLAPGAKRGKTSVISVFIGLSLNKNHFARVL